MYTSAVSDAPPWPLTSHYVYWHAVCWQECRTCGVYPSLSLRPHPKEINQSVSWIKLEKITMQYTPRIGQLEYIAWPHPPERSQLLEWSWTNCDHVMYSKCWTIGVYCMTTPTWEEPILRMKSEGECTQNKWCVYTGIKNSCTRTLATSMTRLVTGQLSNYLSDCLTDLRVTHGSAMVYIVQPWYTV